MMHVAQTGIEPEQELAYVHYFFADCVLCLQLGVVQDLVIFGDALGDLRRVLILAGLLVPDRLVVERLETVYT